MNRKACLAQSDLIHVMPELLSQWNSSVPRYTSYPTAPQFHEISTSLYQEKLRAFDQSEKPLSLYVHIPFCRSMCLFCGCSVVLNRRADRAQQYLDHLLKEVELVASNFCKKRKVAQLHLGGGTPTTLSEKQFEILFATIQEHFTMLPEAEISIEIDPRTVLTDDGKKLLSLKRLGFNRVSFGVQDLDPQVQEAVRRRQSEEMTVSTFLKARDLGFHSINIDLIYGLPFQTVDRFSKTVEKILELKPDRIALFSYAKIPWLKKHQMAIPDKTLPSTEEKFRIYVDARARFMTGGYTAIGIDHFCLASDPLSTAYFQKKLTRNFQGYTVELAEDMIGFGLTSIGFIENAYFQNRKDLESYQKAVAKGDVSAAKGYVLTEEDIRRRKIILSLMCHFEVEKRGLPEVDLTQLKEEGLLFETQEALIATPLGRLFIRRIAAKFDAYTAQGNFSRVV